MTETKKVQGKVARINLWTKKPGYFINLENDQNEYFGYGSCKAKLGEIVDLEVSEGTGNFKDKFKVEKLHSKQTVKEVLKESTDKSMEIIDKSIKSGENTYFERQNLIIRQTCIKASVELAGIMFIGKQDKTKEMVTGHALYFAERLYAWVTESDQKLPEPPEEP